jgi:hypothetical protein
MNDLLKEAIADAKAVRETAMANAKAALEEAFTPRLQSMLHAKLAEELDDDVDLEEDMELDLGGEEEPEEYDIPMEPEMELSAEPEIGMEYEDDEDSEELDLEQILRELEGDDVYSDDEPMLEDDEDFDGINLDEVIASLREDDDKYDAIEEDEDEIEEGEYKKEMEEAYNVIRYLKTQLQEVNLLNAKLLFSNKLFKNHELNESQKMKVIENFDRAHNMREVKLVYSTLTEGFGKPKSKARIKESYASKPTRSTRPASVITEGTELASRWKKLAGLTK